MQEILKEESNINEFDSHNSESSGLTEWELGNDNDLNNVSIYNSVFRLIYYMMNALTPLPTTWIMSWLQRT